MNVAARLTTGLLTKNPKIEIIPKIQKFGPYLNF